MAYQECLHAENGKFDIAWGTDEYLLAALAVGAIGGVGSSFNFAAPIYRRLIAAFAKGDMPLARTEQYRSVRLIKLLLGFGYMAAAKATMGFLGVAVGPARLPHGNLTLQQKEQLHDDLGKIGFLDWIQI
jgi:N-acetylneuraminate lyase